QIPSMIQTGRKFGMQLLDDAIAELLQKGWISADEAYTKANDKSKFRSFLKTPPTDFTEV
ncbi:MAG: type IV pili twitching motility protein PilT, partial [Syntrophales bacterium]|nr:type IV pili twitching motility protein PilT [Syntrophales bacterium]